MPTNYIPNGYQTLPNALSFGESLDRLISFLPDGRVVFVANSTTTPIEAIVWAADGTVSIPGITSTIASYTLATLPTTHSVGALAWVTDGPPVGLYFDDGTNWNPVSTQALKSYTVSTLPTAGSRGRLAWVTDDIRGVWVDTGTQWTSITGVANVKHFGAKGDGVTDDNAAIVAAIAASTNIYFPPGIYYSSLAITVPTGTQLYGVHFQSFILFGATDGLIVSDPFAQVRFNGITIRTNSDSGGKALSFTNKASACINSTFINVTVDTDDFLTTHRWAYALWATSLEVASFYDFKVTYSATIPVHLEYASNQTKFYGGELHAANQAPLSTRGIEMNGTSGTGGILIFEVEAHGLTIQGQFTASMVNTTNSSLKMFGCHLENTYVGARTDGADVVVNATSVESTFIGVHAGGSDFLTSGAISGLQIIGGAWGDITLAASCNFASLYGVRADTITDNGTANTKLGNFVTNASVKLDHRVPLGLAIGNTGTGAATSASLDIQGTTGALLLPRLSTTQRNALTPSNGMVIYNTTDSRIQTYTGGSWRTDTFGATSVADGGTIAHALGTTPLVVTATPSIANEIIAITAIGATTFTVAIKKRADGSAGTTQTVYWHAMV